MNRIGSDAPTQLVGGHVSRLGSLVATGARTGQCQGRVSKRRRQIVAFDELDRTARQVERRLAALGDAACGRDRSYGEALIAEAHRMVEGLRGDLQQVRNQIGELRHLYCRITFDGTLTGVSEDLSSTGDD